MTMDPLTMIRAMRQRPDIEVEGDEQSQPVKFRRARSVRGRDLGDIPMRPGDPGYASKIPEATPTSEEISQGDPASSWQEQAAGGAPVPLPPSAVHQRIAIYCGRGDLFVLAVEEAPDWDTTYQKKMDGQMILVMRPIFKQLGVKFLDKTGGELDELSFDTAGDSNPAPSTATGRTERSEGEAQAKPARRRRETS